MTVSWNWKPTISLRFAKILLMIVTFIVAIVAVVLIILATTIPKFYDFGKFIDENFLRSVPMAVGIILLIIALLGTYGVIKESCLLINIYGVCLLVVFILEVISVIANFLIQGSLHVMIWRTMKQYMKDYEHNGYVQNRVDFMQMGLSCCGINGPNDWRDLNVMPLPHSCCFQFDTESQRCVGLHEEGCFDVVSFYIAHITTLFNVLAGILACVQLLGAIDAFVLVKKVRIEKSLREVNRWKLQQNVINSLATGYAQLDSKPIAIHKTVAKDIIY